MAAAGRARGRPAWPEELTLLLALRAFASGCAALTGIEAVSDGVPAFRPPEAQNARQVLPALGLILIVLFVGITFLVYAFRHHAGRGGDDELPAGPPRVRAVAALLPGPGRHRRDPDPRREHELRRLPARRVVPRARRLRPAPVRQPGGPARLFERDPHPDRAEHRAPRRLPRRHARPHPALRRRGLPLLHPEAVEHGPVLAAAPGAGLAVRGDGAGRRGDGDRARHGRHRGDEVRPRGVDRRRADPDARGGVSPSAGTTTRSRASSPSRARRPSRP